MKAVPSPDLVGNYSTFIKIAAFSLVSLSLFFLVNYLYEYDPRYFSISAVTSPRTAAIFADPPLQPASSPSPTPTPVVERTGIVDENGVMTEDFVIGEYDPGLIESVVNLSSVEGGGGGEGDRRDKVRVPFLKFKVCDESMSEYVPCMDNVEAVSRLKFRDRGEKYERHCPDKGKSLNCLIPRPKNYKLRIPWPKSRDEVWFDNVPHTRLVEYKGGQNWISIKDDKFIFPGGGTQFIHGADHYLDQISTMVPEISFGSNVRVALDVGCGVASFGAFLFERNVTTLSIAPKDVHENQIQFALERGVPAMTAVFATRRLLYPSQAFDLIHCSRCRVDWTLHDGIWLLEVNRMLRAGGYFVWAAQPVYKHEENLQEQWKEMEDLTGRLCWELIKKEGYIAIWRKPLSNSCYLTRNPGTKPPLCDSNDDPDNVWYVRQKTCITKLHENEYKANVTMWPERLHDPPNRLFSIRMDAYMSRKDIFKAESKYWNDIVKGYVAAFHLKELNIRNVMDMRAGYGGFAAALHDFEIECWVINVVPTSGVNTLPVIYDRGLIGVMHDWCEPFDTYPRTYDLLNAAGLFSDEQKRCNISTIMLEMDRILRPGGRVYIRDTTTLIEQVQEIANAMGWVTLLFDIGEGPHANLKLLNCEKRM